MQTFDKIKEEAFSIRKDEEEEIKDVLKIISIYKDLLGEDYKILLNKLLSADGGLKELTSLTNELYEKAITDSVTGLHSRAYLDDKLTFLETEMDLAFIMGDIDKFHDYNEDYGHFQGDVALRSIAGQFKKSIEERLVKDEVSLIARYGGEEFCSFIRNYQRGTSVLYQLVEGIRIDIEKLEIPALAEAEHADDGYKHKTITIATSIREKDESIKLFMHNVDTLLIKKDKEGRNKVYLR